MSDRPERPTFAPTTPPPNEGGRHSGHRAKAEAMLAEAERVFEEGDAINDRRAHAVAAHLRQCAIAHALLAQ